MVRIDRAARPLAWLLIATMLAPTWPTQAQEPNPCAGRPDETAAIQAAVNAGSPVNFEPRLYCINARAGIRIPSDRTLRGNGATVAIFPGCVTHCKAFETVPGSTLVRLQDVTVIGDLAPAVGFSIGFRGDSVTGLELENVVFRSWRYDGVWLGGNMGTHNARLDLVTVEDFGRNGMSIVNGTGFSVDRFIARRSTPTTLLGAGIDVEGNPGDQISDVNITDSLLEDVVVGIYMHSAQGRKGARWTVKNNVVRNAVRHGIIHNGSDQGLILYNRVYAPTSSSPEVVVNEAALRSLKHLEVRDRATAAPIPVGISVGCSGAGCALTSDDVTIAGNRVEGTTRSGILAGVRNTYMIGNGFAFLPVQPSASVPATAGIQVTVP